MIEERLYCRACNDILRGRTDKRFCNDQCRSRYNYYQRNLNANIVVNINKTLKKNRDILKNFSTAGKSKIAKQTLIDKGFNFDYLTSIYSINNREIYCYCYEMGYVVIDDAEVILIGKR